MYLGRQMIDHQTYRFARKPTVRHRQIVNHDAKGESREGGLETFSVEDLPFVMLKATNLVNNNVLVIKVNDNLNIDAGLKEEVFGAALYQTIMEAFLHRLQLQWAQR